jgi:hypothetical protein
MLGGGDVAVSYDLVLESSRVLNGSKTSSWLPAYRLQPPFENVQEGPAREHPLLGHDVQYADFKEAQKDII